MNYLGIILIFLLFVISITGYVLFLFKRFKVKSEFTLIVTFGFFVVILYISALLNLLPLSAYLISASGLVLFLYWLIKSKSKLLDLKGVLSFGVVVFLVLSLYFMIMFRGIRLTHYDNFSHWALIVKQMLIDDRLPNFTNSNLITFESYPPGSALFIYYIAKTIKSSEPVMLIGQMFLMLSCITALFAFTDKNWKLKIVTLCAGLILLISGTSINDLLVDTLLPLCALANLAVIVYYKDDIQKGALLSLPIMTLTLLIKDSGILFAAMNGLILIFLYMKPYTSNKDYKSILKWKNIRTVLFSIAIPFILIFLWKKHIQLVYEADSLGLHNMSIEYYSKIIAQKSLENIYAIIGVFKNKVLQFDFYANQIMLLWNVFWAVLIFMLCKSKQKKVRTYLLPILCIDLVYVVYLVGLLGMYLLSMLTKEASNLSGFTRYVNTIILFVNGAFLIVFLTTISDEKKFQNNPKLKYIFTFITLAVFLLSAAIIHVDYSILYRKAHTENTLPAIYDRVLSDYPKDDKKSYLVYEPSSAHDSGYTFYLSRYKLYKSNFTVIANCNNIKNFSTHDVLVVLTADNQLLNFMKEKYGLNVKNGGKYSLK